MLPSLPVVDAETRAALLTPSRELDFRTLLRALRERVADATGLIEDGSAGNAREPVLGRYIDSAEYRRRVRPQPLERAEDCFIPRSTQGPGCPSAGCVFRSRELAPNLVPVGGRLLLRRSAGALTR